ncbi:MAG: YqcC family protein [Myxococcales bacterium]|nr:YqcC family protein [Myxococcales bacterium]
MSRAVEAELRHLGRWAASRPHPEDFVDIGPFGMRTLTPEQWLQFVLIPRVHDVVNGKGEFPAESSVSTWAARNFDGDPDAGAVGRSV